MARKKFTDEEVMLAAANAPPGRSRAVFAAEILGCNEETIRLYLLRIEQPERYQCYIAGLQNRRKSDRRLPVFPAFALIALALKISKGDACKAARILGCSKTPVRNYIVAERAKGRGIGNRRNVRFVGNEIEKPIILRRSKKVIPRGEDPLLDLLRDFCLELGIEA
jgi:hypothetical protein